MAPSARQVAIKALHRILDQGCKAEFALAGVEGRDARLVQQLVYGVLRRAFSLEVDYSRFCRAKPSTWARLGLLLGACQIRHMRIPDHAAVSETVAAVRAFDPSSAAYVNAVLRKLAASPPPERLKPYQRAELPRWLYRLWRDELGEEKVQAIAETLRKPPRLCLAVFGDRQAWMERAKARGIDAEAGEMSPHAVLLPRGHDVRSLPGFEQGEFIVMDQAAQAVVLAMDAPLPGETVLDLCAAPGGKTMLLAKRFPDARILAIESQAARLPRLLQNLERLGAGNVELIRADARHLPFEDGSIRHILLDAPCSASGVLRRHPDARFLHQPADIERLSRTQLAMMIEAARVLGHHGQLLYAVCSIHRQENDAVIDAALAHCPQLGLECSHRLLPGSGHDGFFYASLRR